MYKLRQDKGYQYMYKKERLQVSLYKTVKNAPKTSGYYVLFSFAAL